MAPRKTIHAVRKRKSLPIVAADEQLYVSATEDAPITLKVFKDGVLTNKPTPSEYIFTNETASTSGSTETSISKNVATSSTSSDKKAVVPETSNSKVNKTTSANKRAPKTSDGKSATFTMTTRSKSKNPSE